MTTALMLGLMLAFETKEPGIMKRLPHDPKEPILGQALIFRIFLVSVLLLASAFGLFELGMKLSGNMALARTLAANTFVFGEMFYLFNCRSLTRSPLQLGMFSKRWLWGGVTIMTILQLIFTMLRDSMPPLNPTPWGCLNPPEADKGLIPRRLRRFMPL
jgi:cation-transporting ATPase F